MTSLTINNTIAANMRDELFDLSDHEKSEAFFNSLELNL